MRVLYISVYKDGTGYSHAAIETILACEKAGIDIVCRPISMSPMNGIDDAKRIQHLECKPLNNIDVVIQHSLPHTFEYKSGVKNIGVFSWETTHFRNSTWTEHCNLMDEIWTSSIVAKQAIINSGVTKPVRVIPIPCNADKYSGTINPIALPGKPNQTVFYTIGEYTRRKNIVGIIRSYFHAFTPDDNVVLVIKTSFPGMKDNVAQQQISQIVDDIKRSTHIYQNPRDYPPIIVITRRMSDEHIRQLHKSGTFFVSPSHGETWCIPAMDALGYSNPVIASNWGSFPELLMDPDLAKQFFDPGTMSFAYPGDVSGGYLIKGQLAPCFAPDGGFNDLYTGKEEWFEPNLCHLSSLLRRAYNIHQYQPDVFTKQRISASMRAMAFNHASVGDRIKSALTQE
jgi:glycosyltransferase involved in cell wall biosynthesis